jgi:pSer/pThr/pTyr-binding forkhead associated (FHA) protein
LKVKLIQSGPVRYVDDIVIDRFPFLLGRHPECDHQLYHPLVSRRHCRLTQADGQVVVHDLQSKNGTFVNGNRVSDVGILRDGDEINLGCLIYRVCLSPSKN